MTKEQYKENLIRMWDSLRSIEFEGSKWCDGVMCEVCPLNNKGCNVNASTRYTVFEIIETVEQWAKDHPIVTNAEYEEQVKEVKNKI